MFNVIKTGLETSVQDYPGRIGFRNQGFPPSGPMDSWSFRLANRLVGNEVGTAALECQYIGPTLVFEKEAIIAITGADMTPKIDGVEIPMWTSTLIKAGQELTLTFAKKGVRAYIAVAGGIDSQPWLGSQSTFHKAGVGGIEGHALQKGQRISYKAVELNESLINRKVSSEIVPDINSSDVLSINVVYGPNEGWLDDAGKIKFLTEPWKLSGKSDRTGFRLEGPTLTFTDKAHNKPPEHGDEPSNIIDQGYPVGGINLAGETPIILVNDGPSMGGFINPFTVPGCEFWKLAQAKPGTQLYFKEITVQQAQQLGLEQTESCAEDNITK
ncbi:MAG: 5-oxoprolinase subunit C family protein [Ostreibacterium sp.]